MASDSRRIPGGQAVSVSETLWERLSAGPMTLDQAAEGLDRSRVSRTLANAVHRGICERDGGRFVLVRRPAKFARTPEEQAEKRRAYHRQWQAKRRKPRPFTVVKPKVEKPEPMARDVSADVAAFLASGGRVERLPRYAVSQPFKHIGVAA